MIESPTLTVEQDWNSSTSDSTMDGRGTAVLKFKML